MQMTGMGAFSAPTEAATPPKQDGRNLRSERTRAEIVKATQHLMAFGHLRPTCQQIAHAADRSVRSVFQHYPTLNALYREALADAELALLVVEPFRRLTCPIDLARAIVCAGETPT